MRKKSSIKNNKITIVDKSDKIELLYYDKKSLKVYLQGEKLLNQLLLLTKKQIKDCGTYQQCGEIFGYDLTCDVKHREDIEKLIKNFNKKLLKDKKQEEKSSKKQKEKIAKQQQKAIKKLKKEGKSRKCRNLN